MKGKIKAYYSKLEQRPILILKVSFGFLVFSFLTGMLLGKILESQQKEKFLRIQKARQVQEERSLKEIFSKLPQDRFSQRSIQ